MHAYPVVGLAGRARVGKSTAAEILRRVTGGYLYSFADPLRAMLRAGFGIDMDQPQWQARKEVPIAALGCSPRYLLQTLGTEWGRELVHPDLWVIRARQELGARGPTMVLADVRFDNEADWVRREGGLVIHLERPDAPTVRAHASEAGVGRLPDDAEVTNDGTIDQLTGRLLEVLR